MFADAMTSAAQLKEAIESYQALIANYTLVRERLIARRKGAGDHIMVEIDQRLEVNARTIDALGRAVESTREHLKVVEPKSSDNQTSAPSRGRLDQEHRRSA